MKAIKTEQTNSILKGNGVDVDDLPVTVVQFPDEMIGVESCWELDESEIEEVIKTKRIFFLCLSRTHPPILLSTKSVTDNKEIQDEDNK